MTTTQHDDAALHPARASGLLDVNPAPSHLVSVGPVDISADPDWAVAVEGLRAALRLAGVDPAEPRVEGTPERVVRALIAACDRGGLDDPTTLLAAQFDAENEAPGDTAVPVLVGPVAFTSLCEHHLLPFRGIAYLGYIREGEVTGYVGLSKLARLVTWHTRTMGMQERFTAGILADLCTYLKPAAAAVKIRAEHTCMTCRGATASGALTTTWLVHGEAGSDLLAQMN
jgi:GTP cyclohydrolase I